MTQRARLEVGGAETETKAASWLGEPIIVFQGEAVPRRGEVGNPELIRARMAATAFDKILVASDTQTGQDALPEIDDSMRRAMGFTVASNVVQLR